MKVLLLLLSFLQDATKLNRKSSAIFNQFLSLLQDLCGLKCMRTDLDHGHLGLLLAQLREDCLAATFSSQFYLRSFPTSFFNNA